MVCDSAGDIAVTTFQPEAFVRRPLGELIRALEAAGPLDWPELAAGDVRLYHGRVAPPTVDADTRLPPDAADVEIPGVVLERYLGGGGQGCVYAGRLAASG